MQPFSIDKNEVGIIRHKREWEDLTPLYSPAESLAIVEFLRQQYAMLFKLEMKIDKTIVGFRKPKKYAKS